MSAVNDSVASRNFAWLHFKIFIVGRTLFYSHHFHILLCGRKIFNAFAENFTREFLNSSRMSSLSKVIASFSFLVYTSPCCFLYFPNFNPNVAHNYTVKSENKALIFCGSNPYAQTVWKIIYPA